MTAEAASDDAEMVDMIDQRQEIGNSLAVANNQGHAQSFVPSHDILSRIEVNLYTDNRSFQNIQFKILQDNGNGEPDTSTVLATSSLFPSDNITFLYPYGLSYTIWYGWFYADLPDIQVTVGERYYIWINYPHNLPGGACWKEWDAALDQTDTDAYPCGESWTFVGLISPPYKFVGSDYMFRTYYLGTIPSDNGTGANNPPSASFSVSPSSGNTSTIFAFDASSSSDFNGSTSGLSYRWDWENDSLWDTAWTMNETAHHQYSSAGCYTVLLEVCDSNGRSARTVRTITVDNCSQIDPPANATANATIGANIDFDPDTLNVDSKGRWVTVFIELDAPYNVSCVNVSSLLLLGKVRASTYSAKVGDEDADGIPDLKVKFDRNETISALNVTSAGEFNMTITVSGSLFNGTSFNGTDVIKVIKHEEGEEKTDQSSIGPGAQDQAILGIGPVWISAMTGVILLPFIVLRKRRGKTAEPPSANQEP